MLSLPHYVPSLLLMPLDGFNTVAMQLLLSFKDQSLCEPL